MCENECVCENGSLGINRCGVCGGKGEYCVHVNIYTRVYKYTDKYCYRSSEGDYTDYIYEGMHIQIHLPPSNTSISTSSYDLPSPPFPPASPTASQDVA